MNIRTPLEIGLLIRSRRRKLKLSQDALAKKVGVTRQWLIDIERGKSRAEIGLVLRTLSTLGLVLSVDDAAESHSHSRGIAAPADINAIVEKAKLPRSGIAASADVNTIVDKTGRPRK